MHENTPTEVITPKKGIEKFAYGLLGIVVFLLPFFVIPSASVPIPMSKSLLLSIGVLLTAVVYIISIINEGRIALPKNLLSLSVVLLPVVFLISALSKSTKTVSLIGYGFEVGTVVSIVVCAVLFFLTAHMFKSKERMFFSYFGFLVSGVIVALFQTLRMIVGADSLTLNVLTSGVSNLIGNWNDLAIFFGATAILSLVTLEMLRVKKMVTILLYAVFVASLLFLVIVNFSTLWVVLGIFAFVFFLYLVSFDKFSPSVASTDGEVVHESHTRKISWNSLAVLVLSVIFIFGGQYLGSKISSLVNITSLEVRPSWTATMDVVGSALKVNPITGAGPNMFTNAWLMHKPAGINDTLFWNIDFSSGVGLIPTFFATTGLLGVFAWLFFFAMFIWIGIRAMFYPINDMFARYRIVSSFLISFFFWVMAILYVPSLVNFAFAFFFTGLFVAALYAEGILKQKEIVMTHHPKLSFLGIIILMVVLVSSITLGFEIIKKSSSLIKFQSTISEYQVDNDLEKAERAIVGTINTAPYDIFYRGLSELNIIRVDKALSAPDLTVPAVQDEFRLRLANSIENGRQATVVDPYNYQNWLGLSRVYAALVPAPFSISGAYANAKETYSKALALNPHNPTIYLLLARLEVSNSDLKAARIYVNQAIAEKPNYAEAHFLLAQIEVTEGNLDKATGSLETTLLLSPQDPGLFFQLGLLKYNAKNFNGAVEAFQQAIILVPDYANAKYFLGLSFANLGNTPEAIAQFEDIEKSNPGNAEVALILTNLRAGKEPFANAKPPVDSKPENRSELPLEQSN